MVLLQVLVRNDIEMIWICWGGKVRVLRYERIDGYSSHFRVMFASSLNHLRCTKLGKSPVRLSVLD